MRGFWISFPASEWESLFHSSTCRDIRQAAVDDGLIEVNEKYSKGRFSMSARLAKVHRKAECVEYELSSAKKASKIGRVKNERFRAEGNWLFANIAKFEFDPGIQQEECMKEKKHLMMVNRIEEGIWFASRCKFGERFHSNYTSLKSELRGYIRIKDRNDNKTAAIDVKNCQPMTLGMAVRDNMNMKVKNGGMNKQYEELFSVNNKNAISSANSDVERWLKLCQTGRIYEFVMERFKAGEGTARYIDHPTRQFQWWDDPEKYTRKRTKKTFIVSMFDEVFPMTTCNPAFEVIERWFPTVAEYMIRIKQGDYKKLARICQRLESAIMIEGVCGDLMRRMPDLPVITIHDELICPAANADFVCGIIRDNFAKYGAEVELKVEIHGAAAQLVTA